MLDVANLPQDFSIGCYIPTDLWDCDGPPHEYTYFIAAIKAFSIVDEFESAQAIDDAIRLLNENLCGFDAVAVVPAHNKGGNSHAGISQVAMGLAERSSGKVIDATSCLLRIKRIQKLAEGGDRSRQTHIDSIQLKHPQLVQGKRVLLLDDVRCTGNSLMACQDILSKAKPRSVHPLALAQSLRNDQEDPEMAYAYLEHDIHNEYQQRHHGLHYDEENELKALQQLLNFAH